MAINLVTNKLYVADFDANRVTVIDGNQDTVKDIAVGTNPSAVAVNWVTNTGTGVRGEHAGQRPNRNQWTN